MVGPGSVARQALSSPDGFERRAVEMRGATGKRKEEPRYDD